MDKEVAINHSELERCNVCRDKASGYHYNVLSCEGCKGFFRRSIQKSLSTVCRYNGSCEINVFSRRKCPACRFQKCLQAGMQENCLLTEHQCNARGSKRRMARAINMSGTLTADYLSDKVSTSSEDSNQPQLSPGTSPFGSYTSTMDSQMNDMNILDSPELPVKKDRRLGAMSVETEKLPTSDIRSIEMERLAMLPEEMVKLIGNVVTQQSKCERMAEEQLKCILKTNFDEFGEYDTERTRYLLYLRRAQYTILNTQLAVEFAKQTPHFTHFTHEDQIALIKGSISQVLALKMARQYDPLTDTIRLTDDHGYTQDALKYAGLGESTLSLFRFCRTMADMKTDAVEFALLTCICTYSESNSMVKDIYMVNMLQDLYSKALELYCNAKYGDGCRRFTRLIMKIITLRELNILQSDSDVSVQCLSECGSDVNLPEPLSQYFACT